MTFAQRLEGSKGASQVAMEEEHHWQEQSSCVEMLVAHPRSKETTGLEQRVVEKVGEVMSWDEMGSHCRAWR